MADFTGENAGNGADVDVSILKVSTLAVLTVLSALFFGWELRAFFDGGGDWIMLAAASVAFLALFLLQAFFVKNLNRRIFVLFLESVAIFAFFYDFLSQALLAGIAAVFLLLIWANVGGVNDLKNTLKINFFRIGRATLPKASNALIAAACAVYYLYIGGAGGFFLSEKMLGEILAPASGAIAYIIPGFDVNSPIDKIAADFSLKSAESDPRFQSLPPEIRRRLTSEASGQLLTQISDFLGVKISGGEKIDSLLYRAMESGFAGLSPENQTIVVWSVILLLALTLKGFAVVLVWGAEFAAFLAYEILLALGVFIVILESRSREIVILK